MDLYKASHTIFEGIPKIDLGGAHIRGIFPNKLELEAKAYLLNCNDIEIKTFLPTVYVETEAQAIEKLNGFIDRFLLKAGVFFCIAAKDRSIPVGYILCNSPLVNFKDSEEKMGDWTIDFWIANPYRGKGIMSAALYRVLGYLQLKEVNRVYAYTHKNNLASIRVIEKCNLIPCGLSGDNLLLRFGVKLKPGIAL